MVSLLPTKQRKPAMYSEGDALDSGKSPDKLSRDREVIKMVDELFDEANGFRSKGDNGLSLEAEWERAGHRFLGNHWHMPTSTSSLQEGFRVIHTYSNNGGAAGLQGIHRATLNRTQTAIISNVAAQTAQPFVIRFEPNETGDEPTFWLTKRAGESLHKMLFGGLEAALTENDAMVGQAAAVGDVETVALLQGEAEEAKGVAAQLNPTKLLPEQLRGKYGPSMPLSEEQALWVTQIAEAGGQDPLYPVPLPREPLIEVNDRLVADVAQELFDHCWRRCDGDTVVLLNEFLSNIYGHQPIRLQWEFNDELADCFSLSNDHVLNVWIDHTQMLVQRSGFVVFEHVMDMDEAKARWQDREDVLAALDKCAESGNVVAGTARIGGIYTGGNFSRRMVRVRVCWRRHQRVPMTIDEAMEAELITREPVLDEANEPLIDPGTGKPMWRYFLIDSEEEIEPQFNVEHGTDWPDTIGVRQITLLPDKDQLVEDIRCPYADIPYGWNVNIPRPDGSPYGQGEPTRLEDISQQINILLSVIANHTRSTQFPMYFMPATLFEALTKKGFQLHSRPGAVIPLDDESWSRLIAAGGTEKMRSDPAPLPGWIVGALEFCITQHDQLSGNVDVRQGRTPAGVKSGKAITALQEQAAGPLAFKSKFTESTLKRLAKLGMDAIRKWMPERRVGRIVTRYQLPVLREVLGRLDLMELDLTVEIATGRGANRAMDEERALGLYQNQLLSRRSTQERLGVEDPDAESQRIMEDQTGLAQQQGAIQAAQSQGMQQQQTASPVGRGPENK